ncbi:D-alanyl-D-alanine carboxypeptidase/D-alanyl-D-alanine-endopeptidase [Lampropedia puyangensis]|uniref:D-alanyl-D-alanine carboxypeptidase/D-alanyl-D-alanine-endopeptidase n=2 Tax=Lampropedia puyangensis TaxID=1330072 RepID=A0A4S8FE32_9BURK|nr:D-alanyl-D-alanine carboxypeptidase/D-alanyl-D-alanine-endopeptidase [Lampropedia puyangensis]
MPLFLPALSSQGPCAPRKALAIVAANAIMQAVVLTCVPTSAWAQATATATSHSINAPSTATALPEVFSTALTKAKIPLTSASVWVQSVDDNRPPRVNYQADALVSPASTMKLVTTYAALDRLGPAYTWHTRIYTDGPISEGSLRGNLYIQGGGDPKLVMERLWALLRQLQQRGIKVIVGDIVLDRSAFVLPAHNPAAFDDEPLRPYNAAPDALLLNFKSVVMRFVPDTSQGLAHVQLSPPMAHLSVPTSVPLNTKSKNCPTNWRNQLQLDASQSGQWSMAGSYPAACGELNWAVAYPDPVVFANKAVEGMWREMGGSLTGSVHAGVTPAGLAPLLTEPSLSLTEIVRDVNKYSNNVMADHVFLAQGSVGGRGQAMTYEAAQAAIEQWWVRKVGNPAGSLIIDNGSGLSRTARVTAHAMGTMLTQAWHSAVMPELLASLPAVGVDGTMRRSRATGSAHIKTGSLQNVNAIAGYVHANSGKRYVLVAIVNDANAASARSPAFDKLIDWVANDE